MVARTALQAERLVEQEERAHWPTLWAICTAFFMLSVNGTMINVALPTIQRAFNTPTSSLEWLINAYALTLAVLVVTMGKFGDLFGRRKVFLIGMVIFTAASLLCAVAPNLDLLIACRVLQGIGGAIVMPATLSIITATFVGRVRAVAISLWSAVGGLAIVAGPLLGGVLVQVLDWRSIFFINVPVSALVFVLTFRYVRESRDTSKVGHIDFAGVATLTPALFAFTFGLIEGQGWGWTSGRILGLFAASVVFFIAFAIVETRQGDPMVDFGIFRSFAFTIACGINLAYLFGIYGLLFFMTLYMQGILGYTALQAGIHTIPLGLMAVGAPLGARLVERIGARPVLVIGLGCVSLALILASRRLVPGAGYGTFFPSFLLVGCGAGLISSPASNIAMNAVPRNKAGVASGILNMTRQLGSVFGVAVLGAIYAARLRVHVAEAVVGITLPNGLRPEALADGGSQALAAAHLDAATTAVVRAALQQGTVAAYNDALLVAGLVCAVGIVFALALRPGRGGARAVAATPEVVVAERPQGTPALS